MKKQADWPTNGWITSTPEEQGMSSDALYKLIDFGEGTGLDSILVIRHGRLITEAYYAPYKRGIKHRLNSATKGVVGTLVGIAMQQGLLTNLDEPVLSIFPEKTIAHSDDRKKAITLQNLLDMTSGLEWSESLTGIPLASVASYATMNASPDWVQFILDRPMADQPGTRFYYNSGSSHLVSAILTRKTGRSALEFAQGNLFSPLGISDFRWQADPQGNSTGGAGLFLTPIDMAKIGYLYSQNGKWDDKQLLPPAWIEKIKHASVPMDLSGPVPFNYANLFWTIPSLNAYMAVGFNSQIILILPESDIVAVTTSRSSPRFLKLIHTIMDAIKSEGPLPPNLVAFESLTKRIGQVGTEFPPPKRKAVVLRSTHYRIENNLQRLSELVFNLSGDTFTYDLIFSPRKESAPTFHRAGTLQADGYYHPEVRSDAKPFVVKVTWENEESFTLSFQSLEEGVIASYQFKFSDHTVELHFRDTMRADLEMRGSAIE